MRLDRSSFAKWSETVARDGGEHARARSYPGYTAQELAKPKAPRARLSDALLERRSPRRLAATFPDAARMSWLLAASHGVHGEGRRGPTPSAGGLQCVYLYALVFAGDWLAPGSYAYDRDQHRMVTLRDGTSRTELEETLVPSLRTVEGGAAVWVIVGDHARVETRYSTRAETFLQLEAGHLMQNLTLASWAVGAATIPCGGFYEDALARHLALPPGDLVLYTGLFGEKP